MKKERMLFLLLLIFIFVFSSFPVEAAPSIIVYGKKVSFGNDLPKLQNGKLYVPMRTIASALGADIQWDPISHIAIMTKSNGAKSVIFQQDQKTAIINSKFVKMDVPMRIIGKSAMVPLGFIASAFDEKLQWDAKTETAKIGQEVVSVPAVSEPVSVQNSETPVAEQPAQEIKITNDVITPPAVSVSEDPKDDVAEVNANAVVDNSIRNWMGIWEDKKGNRVEIVQNNQEYSAVFVYSKKKGSFSGNINNNKLSGHGWMDGKEITVELTGDSSGNKLQGAIGDILCDVQREVLKEVSDTNEYKLFSGKWVDAWGNLIEIKYPFKYDDTSMITGSYFSSPLGGDENIIGSFRGTIKDGVYSGEYTQKDGDTEKKGKFRFVLDNSGLSYKGMYSAPGETELKYRWDALRAGM